MKLSTEGLQSGESHEPGTTMEAERDRAKGSERSRNHWSHRSHEGRVSGTRWWSEQVLLDATMKIPKSPLGLGNERFFRELIKSNFCGVVGSRKLACRDRGSTREGNSRQDKCKLLFQEE